MIEFQNVYKSFKDKHVLEDINFTVNDGEFVCLIGPSGCGKTTALKMINRLIKPSQGTIYVNGKDISEENEIELRRNIGYVIQQTGLFPHMTVKENIELIPKLKNKNDRHLLEKVKDVLNMVGLDPDEYLDKYPVQMSGGQQQRVGVARAFASEPDIILMDINLGKMSDEDGLILAQNLLQMFPDQKIVILSGYDLPVYRKEAKKLGAKGFINKEVAPEELLHILDAINNGSTYFENTGSFVEELTETEKQVLRMLAGGIKRKEIAEQLFMSERTVSNHLQHIFEKLEVSSAVEAVTKSIKLGYLPPQ